MCMKGLGMSRALCIMAAAVCVPVLLGAAPARPGPSTRSTAGELPWGGAVSTSKAVDRSAPDQTWAALCAAAKAGDLAGFRACCHSDGELAKLFMEAYSDSVVTSFQLANAVAQLGEEGKDMNKSLESTYAELVATGQNRKTIVKGDTAQWVQTVAAGRGAGGGAVAERSMYFRLVGKEWLLDTDQSYALNTSDGRKDAEAFIKDAGPAMKLLKGVVADIKAKKITTVQQMRERMGGK